MDDDDYLDALRPAFGDFRGEISSPAPATAIRSRSASPMRLRRTAPRAGRRCRARRAPDRRSGPEPRPARCGRAGRGSDRRGARGEDIAAPDVLARYQTWRRFDTAPWPWRRTLQPPVFQRQPAVCVPRAMRAWAWSRPPPPSAAVSSVRRRPHRRSAAAPPGGCALCQPRHRSPSSFQKYAQKTRHGPRQRSVELPRLFFQHDRDAVADRVGRCAAFEISSCRSAS
jgi:hypothetical protein